MAIEDVGREHQEKHRVTEWLQSYGGDVWWEEKNAWHYDVFKIRRGDHYIQEKPDLVVKIDNCCFAVEFKPCTSKSSVYDAKTQLHGYWLNHTIHDQVYECDDRAVSIDGFVTATGNSIVGHLFDGRDESILDPEHFGTGRKEAIKRGQLPAREYNMTEQHVRTLWRLRKNAVENVGTISRGPAVGALLSTALGGDTDPSPALLWSGENGQNWRILG